MNAPISFFTGLAMLLGGFQSAIAGPAEKVAVEAFLTCKPDSGYVVVFRLKNDVGVPVEIPEQLLPWQPGSPAIDFSLVGDSGRSVRRSAIVSDGFGRVHLGVNGEEIGDVRFGLIFDSREVADVLAKEDATLRWTYSASTDDGPAISGSGIAKVLGRSFYERCKHGFL